MRRGEIWTASGGGYAGKPRPVAILQDDAFDATGSLTVVPFTTDPTDAPLYRIGITPEATNGLHAHSRLMADKVTTIRREQLGERVGRLSDADMLRLNRALLVFLGLTGSSE